MRSKISDDIVFSGVFVHLKKSHSVNDIDIWFVVLGFLSFQDMRRFTITSKKWLSLRNEAINHIIGQSIIVRFGQESQPPLHFRTSKFREIEDLSECHNQEHYFNEVKRLRYSLTSCNPIFSNCGKELTVMTDDKKIMFSTQTGKLISIKDHKEEKILEPKYVFADQDENSATAFSDDNHIAVVKNDGSGEYYFFDPATQEITLINKWEKLLDITVDSELEKPVIHFKNNNQLLIRINDIFIIRELRLNAIIHQSRFQTEETCAITSYDHHIFFVARKNEKIGIQRFAVPSDMLLPPVIQLRKRSRE